MGLFKSEDVEDFADISARRDIREIKQVLEEMHREFQLMKSKSSESFNKFENSIIKMEGILEVMLARESSVNMNISGNRMSNQFGDNNNQGES